MTADLLLSTTVLSPVTSGSLGFASIAPSGLSSSLLSTLLEVKPVLFPVADAWWIYAAFIAFVIAMLALDLGVFHKESHVVSFKEAASWSIVWVVLAMLFNLGFWFYAGWKLPQLDPGLIAAAGYDGAQTAANALSLQFLTGYIVEKSLSVDNIFVFVVVFGYFAIPPQYQHRILFYGILGALVFRAIFVALGSVLMQYEWVVIGFGVFLVLTGVKMLFAGEKPMEPERNPAIRLLRKFMPVTNRMDGDHFFTIENGRRAATPLFVALVLLEFTDIIFAVDSVPAIFALTNEPLIVFTSNIFAILGLRSLYFLLAGAYDKFHLLKFGLGIVLVFVGLKMAWLNELMGGKFPVSWSLSIICGVVGASMIASLIFPKKAASAGA
jgi:tellurite resistance protein TerC